MLSQVFAKRSFASVFNFLHIFLSNSAGKQRKVLEKVVLVGHSFFTEFYYCCVFVRDDLRTI